MIESDDVDLKLSALTLLNIIILDAPNQETSRFYYDVFNDAGLREHLKESLATITLIEIQTQLNFYEVS